MIEKLVNSKTRLKLLRLFLSNIDNRYYLRELERMLDESLSPLRRQLIKLTNIGILIVEEEANLKYYSLNKNFEGLDELRRMVMEDDTIVFNRLKPEVISDAGMVSEPTPKQVRYDVLFLSFISIFVLITAIFVVYANTKNIKQIARIIATESVSDTVKEQLPKRDIINGEMISKRWKLLPGNIPVLSSTETGEEKKSKEL